MPDQDKKTLDRLKGKTTRLSIILNAGLVLLKFVIGTAIGSVSIMTEAILSSMDLVAAYPGEPAINKKCPCPLFENGD